jgi:starch synthase
MKNLIAEAREAGAQNVIWLQEMVRRDEIIKLYSHAALFVCPSVYEPFGIINLEAMACETPVVASAVGGIPEIVVPGETGTLVEFEAGENFEPKDPDGFARALAAAITDLIDDPERLEKMGKASRKRVEETFSWRAVAEQTLEFYRALL